MLSGLDSGSGLCRRCLQVMIRVRYLEILEIGEVDSQSQRSPSRAPVSYEEVRTQFVNIHTAERTATGASVVAGASTAAGASTTAGVSTALVSSTTGAGAATAEVDMMIIDEEEVGRKDR